MPKHARQWIMNHIAKHMTKLSYNQLTHINKLARAELQKRYIVGGKPPKYGDLARAFTDEELLQFFKHVENPEDCLCWKLMAIRGLRPGEVVGSNGIRAENINIRTGDIRVTSSKNGLMADVHLPKELFQMLCDYVDSKGIEQGTIFPISPSHLKNKFNRVRKRAGLEDVYGRAETNRRRLFRLSQHSLRHYAITSFYAITKDIKATQRFARHRKEETTARYITIRKEEIDEVIERMGTKPLMAVQWKEIV